MTVPRLLDAELLGQFESALRTAGVEVDRLAPGLTDEEIDAVAEPLGLEFPEEVRVWWRWHNGAPPRESIYLLPQRVMLRLKEAVGSYAYDVETGRAAYADPPGGIQPVSELPAIFVQCLASGNVPAPVYLVGDWAAPSRLVLPSFGELVVNWMDFIDRGIYATRPEGGWREEQNYPPDVLARGVA